MRVELDEPRCEGYGYCAEEAPELFELDGDGILRLLHPDFVPGELAGKAAAAIRACPVAALRRVE